MALRIPYRAYAPAPMLGGMSVAELQTYVDAELQQIAKALSGRLPNGLDTQDNVIFDLSTRGIVLKDTQATPHYWRVGVSTLGVLTTTDLGTAKP